MIHQDLKFIIAEHNSESGTDSMGQALARTEMFYEIKVKGQLDSCWSEWFDGLTVNPDDDGYTILSGPVPDQAALHGILARIRDLGLLLLSMTCVPVADEQ